MFVTKIKQQLRYSPGTIVRTSSLPVTGACGAFVLGVGDVCVEEFECEVLVRNGAMRGDSTEIHSSHRAGQPL